MIQNILTQLKENKTHTQVNMMIQNILTQLKVNKTHRYKTY